MSRAAVATEIAISAAISVGVNFLMVRGLLRRVRRTRGGRGTSIVSLILAVFMSVPTIVHNERFVELVRKSTIEQAA